MTELTECWGGVPTSKEGEERFSGEKKDLNRKKSISETIHEPLHHLQNVFAFLQKKKRGKEVGSLSTVETDECHRRGSYLTGMPMLAFCDSLRFFVKRKKERLFLRSASPGKGVSERLEERRRGGNVRFLKAVKVRICTSG